MTRLQNEYMAQSKSQKASRSRDEELQMPKRSSYLILEVTEGQWSLLTRGSDMVRPTLKENHFGRERLEKGRSNRRL